MSIKSQFLIQDNDNSNIDNYTVMMDYSNKTSNNFKNNNTNIYNNKEKKITNINKDFKSKKSQKEYINIKNKIEDNETNINKNISNYDQSFAVNGIKNFIKYDNNFKSNQIKDSNNNLRNEELKNEQNLKNYSTLESNYKIMSKELEELKNQSIYLKSKLEELSLKQNNINNNKSLSSTISFNRTTFINAKKVNNINCIKPYNFLYDKNSSINGNSSKNREKETLSTISVYNNQKNNIKRELNLKKVNEEWKSKIPLFASYFEKSKNRRDINNSNGNIFGISLSMNKDKFDNNYVNFKHKKYGQSTNKIRLKTKILKKSLVKSKFYNLEEDMNSELINELNQKNKLINKLNNSLFEQNKIAEDRIQLLIKDKTIINEKLYNMQKEKDDYKKKKEKEIKKYIQDLNNNKRMIKELYNEKNKLLKSKKDSELLSQKLKNIILEKRLGSENVQNKNYSFFNDIYEDNEGMINLNNENQRKKSRILCKKKNLEKEEMEIDDSVDQNNKILLLKVDQNNMNQEDKNENINFIDEDNHIKLKLKSELNKSININNSNDNKYENKYISRENENINENNLKNSENNNDNIINKNIEIFNNYINIISESKNNQIKIKNIQEELNSKNELIIKLENKIKENISNEESIINKIEKEKEELKNLINLETQKSSKLKKYAEEQQKKYIKYKTKLKKYKNKSKSLNKENQNNNINNEYYTYKDGAPNIEDGKIIYKLKEDFYQLKHQLEEEKNKTEILRLLSENEKEKNENIKNKYNKAKKLNMDLINKLKEREINVNKEIQDENTFLKKQLIEKENKHEELKFEIVRLNNEIELYRKEFFKNTGKELEQLGENSLSKNPINNQDNSTSSMSLTNVDKQRYSVEISHNKRFRDERNSISKFQNLKLLNKTPKISSKKIFKNKKNKVFGSFFSKSNGNNNSDINKKEIINNISVKNFDKRIGNKYKNLIKTHFEKNKAIINKFKNKSSDKVIKIVNGNEHISSSECNSDRTVTSQKSFDSSINIIKESNEEYGENKDGKNKTSSISIEKNTPINDESIDKIMSDKNE